MPVEVRCQYQAERNTTNGSDRKGGHHKSHGSAAALFRDDVPNDSKDECAGDAAKSAGDYASCHKQMVSGRQSAQESAKREPCVENEQGGLAIESVEKKSRGNACDSGADGVSGNDQSELSGIDMEDPHVL